MSKSYDDRIVRMGFDNTKFESNAAKTMTTLDKLNEKLKLKGATEGSNNIQRSIDNVNFAAMERAIVNIERRFSTLGVVGMNVIGQITNGIIGSVKQLEAATIGQIKSGGWSRAMNIANAKFQIEGLGFAWEEVEKAVSYGVKDTAYGLDAAASAASQLAASGVDFKKTLDTVNGQDLTAMHKSLRAISGVAAMTNSSYEDIARIFTTVAGNGRLMGDQLLQLSSRGMNAAAKLAEVLNTTEEEVRDMVSRGKIDFQTFAFAMDDAFGAHAKEANKTFTGALGNMKAALSRVGEIFASPIINKTNTLFISLTTRIDEFKNKLKSIKVPRTLDEIKKQYEGITISATAYDQMLKSMEGRTVTFGEHFAEMWQSGIDAFSSMIKSVDIGWFDKIVEKVDSVTVKITDFFNLLKEIYGESAEEAAESMNDATKTLLVSAEEAQAAKDIILRDLYGSGETRRANLIELFGGGVEGEQHAKNVQAYVDSVIAAEWSYENATIKVMDANEELTHSQTNMAREVKKARLKRTIDELSDTFMNLWTVAKNLGKAAGKIVNSILTAFGNIFDINFDTITSGAHSFSETLVVLSEKLIMSDDTAKKVTTIFTKFFTSIKNGTTTLKNAGTAVWNFVKPLKDSKVIQNAKTGIENLFAALSKEDNLSFLETMKQQIGEFVDSLTVDGVGKSIKDFFSGIFSTFENLELPSSIKDNALYKTISDFIDSMKLVFDDNTDVGTKIKNFFDEIVKAIKNIDPIVTAKTINTVIGIMAIYRMFQAVNSLSKLMESIAAVPSKVASMISKLGTMFENLGGAAVNASKVLVIKAAATAILEVVGSLIIISQIPADDIYRATSVLIVIAGVFAVLMTVLKKASGTGLNIKASLISFTAFSSNLIAIASVILAVGASIFLIVSAFNVVSKTVEQYGESGVKAFRGMLVVILIAFAGLFALGVELRKQYDPAKSLLPTFTAMSVLMLSFGTAIMAISAAMAAISVLPTSGFEHAFQTLALATSCMIILMAMSSIASPAQMATSAIAMIGLAAALNLLAIAIGAMALMPQNDSVLDAVQSLMGVAITMFLGMALISKFMTKNLSQVAGLIVGVLALQIVIGAIIGALLIMSHIDNLSTVTNNFIELLSAIRGLIITLGVIAVALTVVSNLMGLVFQNGSMTLGFQGNGKASSTDTLLAIGAAFLMVAGAIYILAAALEKITTLGSGLATAVAIFGVFVVIIGVLAGIATAIPAFSDAMMSVGATMLMAGAGFALVGVAVLLVCKGISILAPSIMILAINLGYLFEVIKQHWPEALLVMTVFIVITALITTAIVKVAGALTTVGQVILSVVKAVGSILSAGAAKLKNWVSNLSTKGKTAIVAVITTLCAAILKASPQVLNTVGQLLIKLLAYLGKIAGDLALGLVDFLINLINGLADAIRLNSNRIAAALWNVVFSLVSLVISIVNELVHILLGDTLGGLVDDLFNFSELDETINRTMLERRKLAEEADQAKKDYKDSILGVPEATEEASDRTTGALGKMRDYLKVTSEEQKSDLESLKEEYDDLPGYAYDAILRSKQAQSKAASTGDNPLDMMNQFGGDAEYDGSDLLNLDMAYDSGTTYTTAEAEGIIDGKDEIYDASAETTGSAQQAIVDSKEDTKKVVQENFNDPFQLQIRSGKANAGKSVEYVVEGMISAMDDKKGEYAAAAVRLAKAGNRAFEEENKIDSPSKLYYQNGAYIVQGLVNGIEHNTQNVESAVGDMSNAILVSFGNPIDYLSKITTGELVYDPSIRPVFDGSSIRAGASSINSMLQSQTISVSGFSGRLAADISSLDQTNSDVVNEIRALREDLSYMEEAISEMQVVMDTGALVGQMAGPMDNALGQRAIRSGRGN